MDMKERQVEDSSLGTEKGKGREDKKATKR